MHSRLQNTPALQANESQAENRPVPVQEAEIAMFLVTSPIFINVPIRGLLAVETMHTVVQWLENLNIKRNMTSMFVNKKHRYKMEKSFLGRLLCLLCLAVAQEINHAAHSLSRLGELHVKAGYVSIHLVGQPG